MLGIYPKMLGNFRLFFWQDSNLKKFLVKEKINEKIFSDIKSNKKCLIISRNVMFDQNLKLSKFVVSSFVRHQVLNL